ncbi:transposase [Geodermatophilus sp. SYSU D00804]
MGWTPPDLAAAREEARLGRVNKYSEEFRRQPAMLVVDGRRPVREVAREFGVNHETLRKPGRRAQAGRGHARWVGQP